MKKKILSGILALSLVSSLSAGLFTAEAAMLEYESVTESHIMDFEGVTFSDGTTKIEGTGTAVRKHIVVNGKAYVSVYVKGAGNKAEIVTDSVSGSTALKLTYKGTDDIVVNNLFNGWHTGGYPIVLGGTPTVHSTASVRLEKHASNAQISKFGRFESNGGGLGSSQIYNSYIYTEVSANGASLVPVSEFTDKYYDFSEIYNSSTKTAGYVTSAGVEKTTVTTNANKPSDAKFQITKQNSSAAYNGKGTDGETILWLDNLGYEIIDFKPTDIRVAGTNYQDKTLPNIPLNAPVEVRFNQPVDLTSAKAKIKLLKDSDSSEVSADIKLESEDAVYIYPKNQEPGTTYKVTVDSGIKSADKSVIVTSSAKTGKYTTDTDGLEFKGYIVNTNFNDYLGESTATKNGIVDGNFKYDIDKSGTNFQVNGDYMAVEKDTLKNNIALRLKRKASNSGTTKFNYELPKAIGMGKVVVTYDLRLASDVTGSNGKEEPSSFMSFTDGEYTTAWRNCFVDDHFYSFKGRPDNWGNLTNLGTGYYIPMTQSLDFSTKTLSGEFFRTYSATPSLQQKSKEWTGEYELKGFNFAIFGGNSPTDGVYYIDNFKIAHYDYPRIEMVTEPASEIDANQTVTVKFSHAVNEATLSDTVKLYKGKGDGKTLVTDAVIVKDSDDAEGKTIKISRVPGLEYNADYTLEILDDFAADNAKVYPLGTVYTKEIKTKSIIGTTNITEEGKRFNGSFTLSHTGVEGYEYTYELKAEDGENYTSYNGKDEVTEKKKYKLKITGKQTGDTSERYEVKEYTFEVIGEEAPRAENVAVSGTIQMGETLEITYDYIDENDDPDDLKEDTSNTVYSWMVSDTEDGEYKEIATTKTVEVDERFEDKYIKVSVIPVSLNIPQKGEIAYESTAYMGIFRPVTTKAEITREGNVLTASYEAEDKNTGDNITGATYQWYSSTKKDTGYEPITGANGDTYEIGDTEYNKYILVGIKAVSDHQPTEAKELRSAYITAPFAPVITEVDVVGEVKVGNTIGAEYILYDENGEKDDGSVITWYVNDAVYSTGDSLTLTKSMVGATVYFKVQPCVAVEPKTGIEVQSQSVIVGNAGSGGFGGGFSGGASIPSVPSTPTPETPDEEEPSTPTTPQGTFKDMEAHWAKDAVEKLYEKNIIKGVTADEFYPDNTITRAEIAAIVARALNLEAQEADFSDVSKDSWYYDAVASVQAAGIFMGSAGAFRPGDKITRQEIACVLARIIEKYGVTFEAKEKVFTDNDSIASWAKDGVDKVSSAGIINGLGDGSFGPEKNATRAQAVVMISRLLEIMEVSADE